VVRVRLEVESHVFWCALRGDPPLEMPLFPPVHGVDRAAVSRILAAHWGASLVGDAPIKASQNTTFEAAVPSGDGGVASARRVAVRVTPDADRSSLQRIVDEVVFVGFIAARLPCVAAPVPTTGGHAAAAGASAAEVAMPSHPCVVHSEGLTVVVSEWAVGAPIDFMALGWLVDAAPRRQHVMFGWV
jgi:hypothetical protein